ncbi:MAG: helicase 2 family protein [Chlamydiales bacterium]|nr:helicase 2 family protein [Chlamydiales bacterium]
MLNFRKLRQDFAPAVLKSGKELYKKGMILSAKIVHMNTNTLRLSAQIEGKFGNNHETEIEIDRIESETTDSNCDCTYHCDCQHLAAVLFYLEDNFDKIVVDFSQEANLETFHEIDEQEKAKLRETFHEALNKEILRKDAEYQKQALQEYIGASLVLTRSPFFLPAEKITEDKAEIAIIFSKSSELEERTVPYTLPDIQFALRLPGRSKPLNIPSAQEFLDAIRYQEPLYIGGRRYFFTQMSFSEESYTLLRLILTHVTVKTDVETQQRSGKLDIEAFGALLAKAHEFALNKVNQQSIVAKAGEHLALPYLYYNNLESSVLFSNTSCQLRFDLDYLETPAPKLLLKPSIVLEGSVINPEEGLMLECATPGLIYRHIYYRFPEQIKRAHLRQLSLIRDITVPEPLFGTFVENALPELQRFAEVRNQSCIEQFITVPFAGQLRARCDIQYLGDELEAALFFIYDDIEIPANATKLSYNHLAMFIKDEGILARNLTEERELIHSLFQDFVHDTKTGHYVAKSEKKIVEFMTEIVPNYQHRVKFNCPQALLDQFVYEETKFKVHLKECEAVDSYLVELFVEGHLLGVKLDLLWECVCSKRSFIEIEEKKKRGRKEDSNSISIKKILVLDLAKMAKLVPLLEELGIRKLEECEEKRPLWSLASMDSANFEGLPITFSMSDKLKIMQEQMLGIRSLEPSAVPAEINATLRSYQLEGVHWLERLRSMHLNGILADDMGLGKTLQTIVAVTQHHVAHPKSISLIVAPTSLLYNWKEEFSKFNPNLRVLIIDGTPNVRKKRLELIKDYDIIITSYGLLQKDIDIYKKIGFVYAILDEAQHIKNRGTRNAKSAKLVQAMYRLVLTGTPIENSLEELWSLFDFLMPGLLSSYERFVEKYIRNIGLTGNNSLETLRKKTAPFVLRRLKRDVLKELPPISNILYHCHLSDVQQELYHTYAQSARQELSRLVEKEGFEKVHIHVLATLTRLKQICCHPAIFAKEKVETGDSAKYDMLLDLVTTLIEGQHKTVIFSQYTRMLKIMRDDFEQMGIKFAYLDGSSKNRLKIVNEFNEDPSISVFLVSLKAGGTGLNLTGADTVIHYDMWWNPATESQATDRVYRLGQQQSVSCYKMITLGTIEEKILSLQNRKKGYLESIVHDDEEIISKLTWQEVLELLQT